MRQLKAVHATAFVKGKSQSGSINHYPTKEKDREKEIFNTRNREELVNPIVHQHEAGFETLYINPTFVNRVN